MKTLLNILGVMSISGASFVASSAISGLVNFTMAKNPEPSHHRTLNTQAVGDNPFVRKNTSLADVNIRHIFQAHNGTIYMVTFENGLWQSTDGITFTRNTSDHDDNINTMFQAHSGTIYTGGYDGLYQSTDGKTFTQNTSVPDDRITTMLQAHSGTIYVWGDDGLYQSTDGKTFTQNTSFPDDTIITVLQAHSGTIYAGGDEGLYQSTDGKTFTQNTSLPDSAIAPMLQAQNGTIYLGTEDTGSVDGFYQSTDGTTFTKNNSFPSGPYEPPLVEDIFQAHNGVVYAAVDAYLYQSTDGITFTKNTSFMPPAGYINTIFQATNSIIYISTDSAGLWQSTDDITFTRNNSFPANAYLNAIFQAHNGTIYIGKDEGNGLWQFNINLLYTLDFANDYFNSDGYNVFATERSISLKNQYLQSATLDDNQFYLTAPSTMQIPVGKHTITMTVKATYQQDAYESGLADKNGVITLKVWIKTRINTNLIKWSVLNPDQSILYQGGVARNTANTNGWHIIQVGNKEGTGVWNGNLVLTNNDQTIDFSKSYSQEGTIDKNNNFTSIQQKYKLASHTNMWSGPWVGEPDDVIKLYLVDYIGNTYNALLELGKVHWAIDLTGLEYFQFKTGLTYQTIVNDGYYYYTFNKQAIFKFNSALVASATINGQKVDTTKTQTIPIKDPAKTQLDTVIVVSKTNHTQTMHFIDNYQAKNFNAVTWNLDTKTLNIYFSQEYVQFIEKQWKYAIKTEGFLEWFRNNTSSHPWYNLFSNQKFYDTLTQYLGSYDETQPENKYSNIDTELSYPEDGHAEQYATYMVNKIAKLSPQHGIVFHIVLNNANSIANIPSPHGPNYYDQIIYLQSKQPLR